MKQILILGSTMINAFCAYTENTMGENKRRVISKVTNQFIHYTCDHSNKLVIYYI